MAGESNGVIGPLAGIVLAGGRSRRMGTDKASLEWGGRPMLSSVVGVAATRCDPVFVVAAPSSPAFRSLGGIVDATWITDEEPGAGPLSGLAAGLHAAAARGADVAFVCATDMPLVGPGLIDELLVGMTASTQAVVANDAGRDHPMAGLYRTAAAAELARLVTTGERRMVAALETLTTHRITVSDPAWLVNVNAPEDLHRLRTSDGSLA